MELSPTTTRLPVKQILDSNLAWVRREVGIEPKDSLLRSMRTRGLVLPILLTEELVVADGARRVVRADQLRWREVPVIVTSDWAAVQEYYAQVHKLQDEEPSQPMTWRELIDLIQGPLNTMYEPRRKARARQSRILNRAKRDQGEEVPSNRTTDFIGEVAEMLGWPRSDLRSIREILWTINTIGQREVAARKRATSPEDALAVPDHAGMLAAKVARLEKDGGGKEGGLYSLLREVRLISAGQDPATIKTSRAKRNVGDPTYTERKAAAAETQAMPMGRELDAATITNIAKVLTNLGTEAKAYTHVRPSVVVADAAQAAKDVRSAVTHFNGLVRVLRAYAESLEERKA